MYLLLTIALSLNINFPEIVSNASDDDMKQSLVYTLFKEENEFSLAYTQQSYWWSDQKYYQVLIYNQKQWEKLTLQSKRNKQGKWSKPKIKRSLISSESAMLLIKELTLINFWSLENESLNNFQQKDSAGNVTKYSLHDGVNYRFEVQRKGNFRVIESYEPEYFLSKMSASTGERKTFLQGKTIIEKAFKKLK